MWPPPNLYRKHAQELGRDPDTTARALEVAARVMQAGGEPILTLGHLAQRCGVSARYLRRIVDRHADPYVAISRPKRNGQTRSLFSPEPLLKDAQRWILDNMLIACRTHDASYAYQPKRSAVICALRHVGARWLIKIDVHDFFDNINEARVYQQIRTAGYPDLLSFQVARICTRASALVGSAWAAPHPRGVMGTLPQGAPTSGRLANATVYQLDEQLQSVASECRLTYTRYSDDIVFSTAENLSRKQARRIVHRVDGALAAQGMQRHEAKTRIVPPGGRKIVLGLIIEHDRVLLPRRFKRRLDTHVRGVARFGLTQHAQFRGFASVLSFVNHVDGHIAYADSVEPLFARTVRARWDVALDSRGYPVALRPGAG
jgi:RNA-directed DNA polymerase